MVENKHVNEQKLGETKTKNARMKKQKQSYVIVA